MEKLYLGPFTSKRSRDYKTSPQNFPKRIFGSIIGICLFGRITPRQLCTNNKQLKSDTRTLAYEAGRKYSVRVNTISARPLKLRAASAISKETGKKNFIEYTINYLKVNAPLAQNLYFNSSAISLAYIYLFFSLMIHHCHRLPVVSDVPKELDQGPNSYLHCETYAFHTFLSSTIGKLVLVGGCTSKMSIF